MAVVRRIVILTVVSFLAITVTAPRHDVILNTVPAPIAVPAGCHADCGGDDEPGDVIALRVGVTLERVAYCAVSVATNAHSLTFGECVTPD